MPPTSRDKRPRYESEEDSSKRRLNDPSHERRETPGYAGYNASRSAAMQMAENTDTEKEAREKKSGRISVATAPASKKHVNTKSSKATNTTIGEVHRPSENPRRTATIKLRARFMTMGGASLLGNKKRTVINKRSPLKDSFMGNNEAQEDPETNKKVPFIPFFGAQTRVWINVYFGDVEKRSDACELVLDTGSNVIWVNKTIYNEALEKNKVSQWATPYSSWLFELNYADGLIKGKWYKDTISFKHKSIFIDQHIFGIVDENTCLTAKMWRDCKDIKGVFGIGPSTIVEHPFLDVYGNTIRNEPLPSAIDSMKDQKKISAKIFGLYFQLPDQRESSSTSSSSVSSDSDGTMEGELHIGGTNKNAYVKGSMRKVPCTEEGGSQYYYGIDLSLNYDGKELMNNKHGIIDSGTSLICLPEGVLDAYVEKIGKHKDGRPIVTYDNRIGLYRIAKKDISKLKDLEFDFVKGEDAKFKLSPEVQIVSTGLSRFIVPGSTDSLLVFQKMSGGEGFRLGLGWMMHHYVVFDSSSSDNKIWIAKKKEMQIVREYMPSIEIP